MFLCGNSRDLGESNSSQIVAMFHTVKQNRKKKLGEVMAEKVASAWLVPFAVQAGGVLEG